jgi:hypothetical protein
VTLKDLASMIAKKEGKKSQARIGDIREILKLLVQIEEEYLYMDCSPSVMIHMAAENLRGKNGKKKTK